MSGPSRTVVVHLAIVAAMAASLVLCIAYPFLCGRYDELAVPLSTMAQVFGVVGLPLVPIGLLWLAVPRYGFGLAISSMAIGTGVALILALFATLSVGNAFGVLTLAVWVVTVLQLWPHVARRRRVDGGPFNPAPLYLMLLPAVGLVAQLALAGPLTTSSRARAIGNASEFIGHIEAYRATHGRYPLSLQAQNRDYDPQVVGVETYVYASSGDSYDLSFEQPRFLLDRFGTREWVVYNPRDQQRAYSHTAWRLGAPEEQDRSQGWYASGDTGYPRWRSFWFD
jgi:hypothetical protein